MRLPNAAPIVKSFKYLGIDIYPSLHDIASKNFNKIISEVSRDLSNWSHLPKSLYARISVVKMNVLPRVNFYSSMIPLPPPTHFWDNLNSTLRKYIWNGKCARIRLSTMQRFRQDGGLSFPDFKVYAQAFVIRPISVWFGSNKDVAWRAIEESMVTPYNLRDLVFCNIPIRQCNLRFGPIITHLLSTWKMIERRTDSTTKWHCHFPLFNNNGFLSGNAPFRCPQWADCNITTLGDLYDDKGLRTFQDLTSIYNIPASTFYFYLRIRSAINALGIPLNTKLPVHPVRNVIYFNDFIPSSASAIYSFIMKKLYKPLGVVAVWSKDLEQELDDTFADWTWEIINMSSRNPNHQMIHWKLAHRVYLTPLKRFYMRLTTTPNCTLCQDGKTGTFLHFFWECSVLAPFWLWLAEDISTLIEKDIVLTPDIFFLNDFSNMSLTLIQTNLILAAFTAAKKMLVSRWCPPHTMCRRQWALSLLDILTMELSTARMHGARSRTVLRWSQAVDQVKSFISNMGT